VCATSMGDISENEEKIKHYCDTVETVVVGVVVVVVVVIVVVGDGQGCVCVCECVGRYKVGTRTAVPPAFPTCLRVHVCVWSLHLV